MTHVKDNQLRTGPLKRWRDPVPKMPILCYVISCISPFLVLLYHDVLRPLCPPPIIQSIRTPKALPPNPIHLAHSFGIPFFKLSY
jgi:hypothetical protein